MIKLTGEVQEGLKRTKFMSEYVRPRLVCKDGWSVSIQVGETMYSDPRAKGDFIYERVEAGYPDAPVPEYWHKYAEDKPLPFMQEIWKTLSEGLRKLKYYVTDPDLRPVTLLMLRRDVLPMLVYGRLTQTIYPYIPIELVERAVQEHGGIESWPINRHGG